MRKWMTELRERMEMSLFEMSKRCECSEMLLYYLENGSCTLPSLARQIGMGYGMTLVQANELAKPLKPKYSVRCYGTCFEWVPPKDETVPLIAQIGGAANDTKALQAVR